MSAEPAIPDPDGPSVTFLTLALHDLRLRRAKAVREHEQALRDFDAAIRQTERERARELVLRGLPLETVRLAESVLEVFNPKSVLIGQGTSVLAKAIEDLAFGAKHLRHSYMGTKDYDRFHGQEEGGSYGSGPRHGHTIFSIGLKPEARERPLTPEETEAAIRYLLALRRVPPS